MTAAALDCAALELHDLTVAYDGHPAVHHVDGRFEAGTLTAVVGPNGAGKSSLLGALAGRIRPSAGSVRADAALRGRIAWLPQHAEIDRSVPMRVADLVALGHWWRTGSLRPIDRELRAAVSRALDAVGLAGFEARRIGELSVGQFQRVLFARLLLQDAPVILLDEPFNAIDARTTADLLALVHRWHGEARTVIAVLHDLDLVREHFHRTLLLARRCVAWGPTAEVLQPPHLLRARRMAEAWDDRAPRCDEVAG